MSEKEFVYLTIDEIITILMKLSPSNKIEEAIAEKLKNCLRKMVAASPTNTHQQRFKISCGNGKRQGICETR